MESGCLFFDPTACNGNMLFLGNADPLFRGAARTVMNVEEGTKRRPFFSSPDEMFEEEYFDEQVPEKKRRLTPEQVHLLEKSFEEENKLEPERKTQLAKKLGLQPRQVAVWFQNRRARWKTKQLEREYDVLKSSYDTLLANYECIVKENDKLKSEVVSLNEKLQGREVAPAPAPGALSALRIGKVKGEDRLSSGSGGSSVVDEDGPHLVDSGNSCFPGEDYHGAAMKGVQSDEDDGRGYLADVFAAAEQQQPEEGEPLAWWLFP